MDKVRSLNGHEQGAGRATRFIPGPKWGRLPTATARSKCPHTGNLALGNALVGDAKAGPVAVTAKYLFSDAAETWR